MPRILTKVRVHNPGKRRLSLAQKLHFGTKRQRAAAKVALSSGHKKRRVRAVNGRVSKYAAGVNRKQRKAMKAKDTTKAFYRAQASGKRYAARKESQRISPWNWIGEKRVGNPGEIITLSGLAGNPGKLKKRKVGNIMAKRRRKSVSGVRRRRTRRAHNPKVVVRYRTRKAATHRRRRRMNTGRVVRRRRSHRRSNPGFLSGGVGMLVGIFGGAALTGAIAARVPGQLNSGIAGYLTTAVVAYAQGTLAGKLLKNPTLGKNMVTGGLIYLGLKIAGDLIPGLSLPFGLAGMGAIAPSSFYVPQVPAGNSMINFQAPAGIPVAPATRGMARIARMGRMN